MRRLAALESLEKQDGHLARLGKANVTVLRQKKLAAMVAKRIFAIVMPGKIVA
jgi:hypothetical protein